MVREKKISRDTANTYVSCIRVLSKEGNKCDATGIEQFLINRFTNKKQITKYMAAIRKYEKEIIGKPKSILFGEPAQRLSQFYRSKDPVKEVSLSEDTTLRKINALRNKTLKYALRLQIKSGLRAKEIADLRAGDILFKEDGEIEVHVRHGKGDKERFVSVLEDDYLYKYLPGFIKVRQEESEKLFYSRDYYRHKAKEHGIETHDLRRHNARRRYAIEIGDGKGRVQAKKTVMKELGHELIGITNRYLGG